MRKIGLVSERFPFNELNSFDGGFFFSMISFLFFFKPTNGIYKHSQVQWIENANFAQKGMDMHVVNW